MEGPLVADLRRAFTFAGVICPSISRVPLSEDSFAVLAVGAASSLPVLQGLKLPSRLLQTRQLQCGYHHGEASGNCVAGCGDDPHVSRVPDDWV